MSTNWVWHSAAKNGQPFYHVLSSTMHPWSTQICHQTLGSQLRPTFSNGNLQGCAIPRHGAQKDCGALTLFAPWQESLLAHGGCYPFWRGNRIKLANHEPLLGNQVYEACPLTFINHHLPLAVLEGIGSILGPLNLSVPSCAFLNSCLAWI